jgi:hypothetical protein
MEINTIINEVQNKCIDSIHDLCSHFFIFYQKGELKKFRAVKHVCFNTYTKLEKIRQQ